MVGVVADGTVGGAELILHAGDAAAVGVGQEGTIFVRHKAAPGTQTAGLAGRISELVPEGITARIVGVGVGKRRRRAPLVLSLSEVKERIGEFAFRPRAGVREIEVAPTFPARHITTVEVPILGAVTCHRGIISELRAALNRIVEAGLADDIDPQGYGGC